MTIPYYMLIMGVDRPDRTCDRNTLLIVGLIPFEPQKKTSYFPLNPGWLIGILTMVYCIIPIELGRI